MRTVPPTEKGKYRAIASGAIANGKPVVVNSDGTVAVPNPDSVGSATIFNTNYTNYIIIAFDSNSNKVVVAWSESSNNYGQAAVGTVSGTSISFGTTVTFSSTNSTQPSSIVFDSNANKVAIFYKKAGVGKAIVGTVSGTDISFGTEAQFEAEPTTYVQSAAFDSNSNKIVMTFRDPSNGNYGTAIVGTISGTDITFGTAVVFESADSRNTSASFDSTNNKVVITYSDYGNSGYATGIVGTVSGTSISFGSATAFTSSAVANYMVNTYDPDQQKTIVAYSDSGNSHFGFAVVGTVSGTSISFGSAIAIPSPTTSASGYLGITYDTNEDKILITNSTGGFSVVSGTVSGNSISFGDAFVIDSDTSGAYSVIAFDSSNNKSVVAYYDGDNSGKGTAHVLTLGTGITLTTENYIGIANSCSFHGNTETITVTVAGGIFYLDGVANPVIQLLKGHTYIFDQADNTNNGHPLHFKDSGGSQYTTGVTVTGTAGTSGAKVTIAIASDATEPTRYYCTVHGNGMGNTINLSDSFVNVDVIGTVNDQQSSLTAGQQYFVQTDGTLGLTADSPSVFAGTAISATELVVKE